jgi:hypothetical protein
MRNVLITAVALVALVEPAERRRQAQVVCGGLCARQLMTGPWTPEEFHTMQYALRSTTGIDMNPIAPGDVEKDDKGAIHVQETGSGPNGALDFNFFTSKDEGDKFVNDEGISPQQAPNSDIKLKGRVTRLSTASERFRDAFF